MIKFNERDHEYREYIRDGFVVTEYTTFYSPFGPISNKKRITSLLLDIKTVQKQCSTVCMIVIQFQITMQIGKQMLCLLTRQLSLPQILFLLMIRSWQRLLTFGTERDKLLFRNSKFFILVKLNWVFTFRIFQEVECIRILQPLTIMIM